MRSTNLEIGEAFDKLNEGGWKYPISPFVRPMASRKPKVALEVSGVMTKNGAARYFYLDEHLESLLGLCWPSGSDESVTF